MLRDINGISLNVVTYGEGPALLLLHGFTGSAATWEPLRGGWPQFQTLAVDLIGHGVSSSPLDQRRYSIPACIDDLLSLLDSLAIDRCGLLGYSMGGRVALRFALAHPERLWGLILESTNPGIEDESERSRRVEADEALATRIEADGIASFVDYWQSIPLWQSQSSLAPEIRLRLREQRLSNSSSGLANSLRGMGAGVDRSVSQRLSELKAVPTLLLAGSLDQRYAEAASAMAQATPGSELGIVAEAGHAVHLEQPDAFAAAASDFLLRPSPVALREN